MLHGAVHILLLNLYEMNDSVGLTQSSAHTEMEWKRAEAARKKNRICEKKFFAIISGSASRRVPGSVGRLVVHSFTSRYKTCHVYIYIQHRRTKLSQFGEKKKNLLLLFFPFFPLQLRSVDWNLFSEMSCDASRAVWLSFSQMVKKKNSFSCSTRPDSVQRHHRHIDEQARDCDGVNKCRALDINCSISFAVNS